MSSTTVLQINHSRPTHAVPTRAWEVKRSLPNYREESVFGSFLILRDRFEYDLQHKFNFMITEEYQSHFILIKGLLEFYRGSAFTLVYDGRSHSFTLTTREADVEKVKAFFKVIQTTLEKEFRFRANLRRAIEFEKKYRREQEAIYSAF